MKDFLSKHKKSIVMFVLFCLAVSSVFADPTASQEAATGMNNVVSNIVGFFDSGWVKGIACIALIAECIGLLFAGGQNPGIFKKFLPLIAGTVIFMCAGKIVTLIFGDSGTLTTDLKMSYNKDGNLESSKDFKAVDFDFIV